MDSSVQLAIAAKAAQVFGGAGKFLCFPALTPFSYAPERLQFGSPTTAADLRTFREFSIATNHIVRGPLYDITDERLLSDVVRNVLDYGVCAAPAPATFDDAAYRDALTLLYVDPDATPRLPSEAVRIYARYRDAVQVAKEHFANLASSAASAGNPEARERWTTIEEPSMRAQITALEAEWESKGKRTAIEAAREVERSRTLHQASLTWAQWRAQFMSDVDMRTDAEGVTFAPTSFSPGDIAESDDWQEFSLSQAEIAAFAESAPTELKQVFGSKQSDAIESIRFECRSARLERPWLPRELFGSRFWRQPEGAAPISDGENLSIGLCPAYAVAVVFARQIEVTRKVPAGSPPRRDFLRAAHLFRLEAADVLATRTAPSQPPPAAPAARAIDMVRAARLLHAAGGMRTLGKRRRWSIASDAVASVAGAATTVEGAAQPATGRPTASTESDPVNPEITVLAFICRRVPRSPDPDPSLNWT